MQHSKEQAIAKRSCTWSPQTLKDPKKKQSTTIVHTPHKPFSLINDVLPAMATGLLFLPK